ncbi:hypothetical protein pb186bvf_017808 [Paramecium bursaria]
MSYSEIQQQREYIDQIREEESKKKQLRDTQGNDKYLEIGLYINERFHKILLRIYEDCSIEKLVLGNDISELNFDQGIKDETKQYIRPILNYKNKFTRCHFHLSYAQTIAIVVEYKLVNYKRILEKVCHKYQLQIGQLGEEHMYNYFEKQGEIQIMSLARQFQQVVKFISYLLINLTQDTELVKRQNIICNFKQVRDFEFDQRSILNQYTDANVKINNKQYSLKLLNCNNKLELVLIQIKQKIRNMYKYKVQGGDKTALEINIMLNDQNENIGLEVRNLIPINILKHNLNDQFEVVEYDTLIIKSNKITLQYTQQDGLQTDEFEINII